MKREGSRANEQHQREVRNACVTYLHRLLQCPLCSKMIWEATTMGAVEEGSIAFEGKQPFDPKPAKG
jgi:hypothetical protein